MIRNQFIGYITEETVKDYLKTLESIEEAFRFNEIEKEPEFKEEIEIGVKNLRKIINEVRINGINRINDIKKVYIDYYRIRELISLIKLNYAFKIEKIDDLGVISDDLIPKLSNLDFVSDKIEDLFLKNEKFDIPSYDREIELNLTD